MLRKTYLLILYIFMMLPFTQVTFAESWSVGDYTVEKSSLQGQYQEVSFIDLEFYEIDSTTPLLRVGNNTGKYGLIDTSGSILVPLQYDYDMVFKHDLVIVKNDHDYLVWNYKAGQMLADLGHQGDVSFMDALIRIVQDDMEIKYLLLDGSPLNLGDHIYIESQASDQIFITSQNYERGPYGISTKDGRQIADFIYDRVEAYTLNVNNTESLFFLVSKEGLFGMLDSGGSYCIPLKFEYFSPRLAHPEFHTGISVDLTSPDYSGKKSMCLREKYLGSGTTLKDYIYDFSTNDLSLSFTYEMSKYLKLEPYKDNLYFFIDNTETAGLMDENAHILESVKRNRILERYENGLYATIDKAPGESQYTTSYAYVNSKGKTIGQDYNYVQFPLLNHPNYIVINKFAKEPTRYTEKFNVLLGTVINMYHNDEKLENRYGLMDQDGNIIVEPEYSRIYDLAYPLADLFLVEKNQKYGFIDEEGNLVHDLIYDSVKLLALDESNHYATVSQNGKYGIVDYLGNVISPCILDNETIGYGDDLFIASVNGKWGALNTNGETAIPFIYETKRSWKFVDGLAQFGRGTNSMRYDAYGNFYIDKAQYVLLSTSNALILELDDTFLASYKNQYFVRREGLETVLYKYSRTQ